MAINKLAFLAVAVLLLQASWCAVADKVAKMALTSFEEGKDGGGPAACDGEYHSDGDLLVALPTDWYAGGSLCNKKIRITRSSQAIVEAMVVDKCGNGCKKNVIATSKAVWAALKLDTDDAGEVDVIWIEVK